MNQTPVAYQTVTVGSTANFVVEYESANRGANLSYDAATLAAVQRRGQAILDTCEHDLAALREWFGYPGASFGPFQRIRITLTTLDPEGGFLSGAYNTGYLSPIGLDVIVAPMIFVNPLPTSADDDTILGLVVAELIEVVMGSQGSWRPDWSSGEGLSRVAAHLLHPTIITSFFDPAPIDIDAWMSKAPNDSSGWETPAGTKPTSLPSHNAYRQDWVSQNFTGENGVPGDEDWFSFGCAILFIYYLKDQLGFSLPQIVQSAGDTLEERYQSLTGNTGGFGPFKALLDAFYPTGASLPTNVYDLFPLGKGHCSVVALAATVHDFPRVVRRTGVAFAGTMCGGGEFSYALYDLQNHLRVTANTAGLAHPVLKWSINGHDVFPLGNSGLTVPALVTPADPTLDPLPTLENIQVNVTTGFDPTFRGSSAVDVYVVGHPGQVQLRVDVTASDKYAVSPDNSATSFAETVLETQQLVWAPEYRRAVDECWNRYIVSHNRPLPWLRNYMPDPPPVLLTAIAILEQIVLEVREVATKNPDLAQQINQRFGGHLLSADFLP